MLDTLVLIKKSPHQALVDILNHHNGQMIQYSAVEFYGLTPLTGKATKVTIRAKPVTVGKPTVINEKEFTFNRIDLEEFLTPEDRDIIVQLPATTNDVVNALVAKYEMVVTPTDFIIENISSGETSYILKAHNDSLRWFGYATVTLTAPGLHLNQVITINVLNGLNLPYNEDDLGNVLTVTTLDGLSADIRVYDLTQVFPIDHIQGYWFIGDEGYEEIVEPSKSGKALLHDLLSTVNTQPITMADYTATALTGIDGYNSRIRLRGVTSRNYYGEVILPYNRFDVSTFFGVGEVELKTDFINTFNLLRTLEDEYECVLADNEFTVTGSGYGDWTLTTKGTSLGWVGTKTFQVSILTPPFTAIPYLERMTSLSTGLYYTNHLSSVITGPVTIGTDVNPQPWDYTGTTIDYTLNAVDGNIYLNGELYHAVGQEVTSLYGAFSKLTGRLIITYKVKGNENSVFCKLDNGSVYNNAGKQYIPISFGDCFGFICQETTKIFATVVPGESEASFAGGVTNWDEVGSVDVANNTTILSVEPIAIGSPLIESVIIHTVNPSNPTKIDTITFRSFVTKPRYEWVQPTILSEGVSTIPTESVPRTELSYNFTFDVGYEQFPDSAVADDSYTAMSITERPGGVNSFTFSTDAIHDMDDFGLIESVAPTMALISVPVTSSVEVDPSVPTELENGLTTVTFNTTTPVISISDD